MPTEACFVSCYRSILGTHESNSFGKDFTSYSPTSGDWGGETVPRDVNQVFATSVEAERCGQRSI